MTTAPLIENYLSYQRSIRAASERTIAQYRSDLVLFLSYEKARKVLDVPDQKMEQSFPIELDDLDVSFLNSMTQMDIFAYLSYLSLYRKNAPGTRAKRLSAIRSFLNFYYKQNLLSENICEKIDSPKIPQKLPVYLTLTESKAVINAVLNDKTNAFLKNRDLCMIVLFLNTGMRLSELSSIDIPTIQEDSLRVVGKGNKERTIFLNPSTKEVLERYLSVRPKVKTDALFLSTRKTRMTNRAIQFRIERYIQLAGLDPAKYSVHKLRHTAATLLYKYGNVDVLSLKEILGHANVATTQIYTHLDEERLRDAFTANPLGHMDLE